MNKQSIQFSSWKKERKKRNSPAAIGVDSAKRSRWRWEQPERNRILIPDVSPGTEVQICRSLTERSGSLAPTSALEKALLNIQQVNLCRCSFGLTSDQILVPKKNKTELYFIWKPWQDLLLFSSYLVNRWRKLWIPEQPPAGDCLNRAILSNWKRRREERGTSNWTLLSMASRSAETYRRPAHQINPYSSLLLFLYWLDLILGHWIFWKFLQKSEIILI